MIFKLAAINSILPLEKELHEDFLKERYIQSSLSKIYDSLTNHFANDYLFHRVYFVETGSQFVPVELTDIKNRQNQTAKDYINLIEKKIIGNDDIEKSFAEIILDRDIQGVVLFNGSTTHTSFHNVVSQNLGEDGGERQLAEKLAVAPQDIKTLFYEYFALSKRIKGNFFAYFIRPFAHHKHYNGTFLILLRRPLVEKEFIEIGYVWTKILSETSLLNAKKAEQDFIFEEHNHTWNPQISSIMFHLDSAYKALQKTIQGGRVSKQRLEIYEDVAAAHLKVQQLRLSNIFNLLLLKTNDIDSWEEIRKIKSHIVDQNVFKELFIAPVYIKTVLDDCLKTLAGMFKSLEFISGKEVRNKLNMISSVRNSLDNQPNPGIKTICIGLKIIFLDLLKNTLLHTDDGVADVALKIETVNNGDIVIHFINNKPLTQEAYQIINSKVHNIKRSGGLRTIKRILNSKLLSEKRLAWHLQALESSLTGNTDIIIRIPKADCI